MLINNTTNYIFDFKILIPVQNYFDTVCSLYISPRAYMGLDYINPYYTS